MRLIKNARNTIWGAAFKITLNLRYTCKTMMRYHIIGSCKFPVHIIDKDGEKMNQHDYDEYDEFYGMSEAEIEWHTTNHSEDEWKEYRKNELIKQGYKEQEVEEYFEYIPDRKRYLPTPKLEARFDSLRKIAQLMKNLYSKALKLDVGNNFESFYNEALMSIGIEEPEVDIEKLRKECPFLFDSEPDEEDLCMEDYSDVPQETDEEFEKRHFALDRVQSLSNRGLSIDGYHVVNFHHYEYKHTIDDIEYVGHNLYHIRDEVGIYYDEYSELNKYVPHERHVEELLKIVQRDNIPLLVIYWEQDDKPIWEIYIDGKFVRQQSVIYSYEGYVYDKKMIDSMAELKDADIGRIQKAIMEFNTEAKEIVYEDEEQVRIAENKRKHDELAQIVAKMQQKYEQLGFAFSQVTTTNDGLDEVSHRSICDALDSFADTIAPGLAAAAYEEKAKKIYPFYSDVASSSQRYLRTAVALEEHITEEHYDICPLYFELCRVFENELDIRIFSEYTNELLNRKEFKAEDGDYEEACYRIILDAVTKARREKKRKAKEKKDSKTQKTAIRVFVPEKMKVISLYMVEADIGMESVCQTSLLNFLKSKRYKLECFADIDNFNAACRYVENRNRYTHPDDNMDAAELQKELKSIKEQTNARMDWLIKATQSEE